MGTTEQSSSKLICVHTIRFVYLIDPCQQPGNLQKLFNAVGTRWLLGMRTNAPLPPPRRSLMSRESTFSSLLEPISHQGQRMNSPEQSVAHSHVRDSGDSGMPWPPALRARVTPAGPQQIRAEFTLSLSSCGAGDLSHSFNFRPVLSAREDLEAFVKQ